MLVLSRKRDEAVVIDGGNIVVTVVEVRGDKVRLGFEAPLSVKIDRKEIWLSKRELAAGDLHSGEPHSGKPQSVKAQGSDPHCGGPGSSKGNVTKAG